MMAGLHTPILPLVPVLHQLYNTDSVKNRVYNSVVTIIPNEGLASHQLFCLPHVPAKPSFGHSMTPTTQLYTLFFTDSVIYSIIFIYNLCTIS